MNHLAYKRIYTLDNVHIYHLCTYAGLMIMASHQRFSGQIKHMSGQIKFGRQIWRPKQIWPDKFSIDYQWKFMEFAKESEYPDNFQSSS